MSQFVEYPKCLYKNADFSGETLTVTTPDQEVAAKAYGWMTCEQIYGIEPMPEPPAPPADPPAPDEPVVVQVEPEVVNAEEPAPKRKAKK